MRPTFNVTRGADVARVQEDVQQLVLQFSESAGGVLLPRRAIAITETLLRHGLSRVPLGWRVHSPEDFAHVKQTRAPDSTFLYLQASATLTCGVEVF